jgi:hypothetical protein
MGPKYYFVNNNNNNNNNKKQGKENDIWRKESNNNVSISYAQTGHRKKVYASEFSQFFFL